jgi:hypothetical protein
MKLIAKGAFGLGLLGAITWGVLALWIDGPAARWPAALLAATFVVASLVPVVVVKRFWRGAALALVPFALVLAWWLSIAPSNARDWAPDVAHPPVAEIHGDQVTIRNVRNFAYGDRDADPTEHWETRTFDLDDITGLDLFISFWGPTLYAHTIMSWELADGRHLAISIETRKEAGEGYSALLGFFRQFELYYVIADERDVIGVRATQRGERVYLYRLKTAPDDARALLLSYLEEANRLARQPKWYNALRHNCTTVITHHIDATAPGRAHWDWRILANGYLDAFAYDQGSVNTTMPLAELKRRSDITAKARAASTSVDFSRLIREGLPARPAAAAAAGPG